MRRPLPVAVAVLATLALGACGEDRAPLGRDTAASTATATRTTGKPVVMPRSTDDGCGPVAAPVAKTGEARRPRRRLNRAHRFVARVRTNCGTFAIKLDALNFPKTTRSFVALARAGFYDGLTIHRVARPGGNDFVIQGGDPLGDGNGGPGYSVVEKPRRGTTYPRLSVAMAKAPSEPAGTSGSQFFIVTGDGAGLEPLYASLGRVIRGGPAVRRIAAVRSDPVSETPIDPVVIKKVTIKESRR